MRIALKILLVFLIAGLFLIQPTDSYAWDHGRGHSHAYVSLNLGWPGPYYGYGPYYRYYGDPYYYPSYPAYTVVESPSFQAVVVNGATYYVNNGVYYVYTQYGYQAVQAPVGIPSATVQAQTATVSAEGDDALTVNVPNDKGGYNAVIIKRSGQGFVGPQGEFYSEFPKVSQLKLMYGK